MIILAIETSCDETAAAVLKDGEILSNIVFSQEKIHSQFGGIVPEFAARAHVEVIIPIIKRALQKAKIKKEEIDTIAVTYGPGLIISLMIGIDTAKSLAFALKKPLIAVNHLEGHVYANFIGVNFKFRNSNSEFISNFEFQNSKLFPLLCLIVSGGHTELVYMTRHLKYKLIGETRDDAAGECFDKVAKLLGLGYPGGPIISKFAKNGNPQTFNFSRPMIDSGDFDFSFSGLKTDVLRLVRRWHSEESRGAGRQRIPRQKRGSFAPITIGAKDNTLFSFRELADICASFQAAVCDVLVFKTLAAAKKFRVKTIALAGGVAANKFLREKMAQEIKNKIPNIRYLIPDTKYCGDNAAMIAVCAYFKFKANKKSTWKKIQIDPNAKL